MSDVIEEGNVPTEESKSSIEKEDDDDNENYFNEIDFDEEVLIFLNNPC